MNFAKKIISSGLAWLWLAILVIAIDRNAKLWAVHHLNLHEPIAIFPVLNFTLAYNTGAAFSFLQNAAGWQNIFLGSLAVLVSIIIVVWLAKRPAKPYWTNIALALVVGGAIGNAWDRVVFGYVIDFLSFHWGDWYFAIFNTADTAICIGAAMLFLEWTGLKKT